MFYVISLLLILSCEGRKKEVPKKEANYNETLIKVNKYLVGQDADKIRKYIKRRDWDMKTTATGLWYMIYEKGKGTSARPDKAATIRYKVYLLDGTLCYTSEQLGSKKFTIGKGGVERGLEEGILLLHLGDKARFILPPHLAQGLTGDGNKIPPRSIILYEVELIQISD
jgi:FKBP-type peptidyl-prolyl cis-trans isomerase